jgi:hypothetical protein
MPSAKWTGQPGIVEAQGLFRRPADGCHADDEEVVVSKHEMLVPAVVPRVEETGGASAHGEGDVLLLALIAERAAPGKVIEVIGAAPRGHRPYPTYATGDIVIPATGWDDVIDLELADRRQQAVLAGMSGAPGDSDPDAPIMGIMPRLFG